MFNQETYSYKYVPKESIEKEILKTFIIECHTHPDLNREEIRLFFDQCLEKKLNTPHEVFVNVNYNFYKCLIKTGFKHKTDKIRLKIFPHNSHYLGLDYYVKEIDGQDTWFDCIDFLEFCEEKRIYRNSISIFKETFLNEMKKYKPFIKVQNKELFSWEAKHWQTWTGHDKDLNKKFKKQLVNFCQELLDKGI